MFFQSLSQMMFAVVCTVGLATAASAQEETILEVTHADEIHSFTLEELQALPVSSFETTTIWSEGPQTFEGVSLKDLLDTLEVSEGEIQATAINDYSITIPLSDATEDGPIIAYHTNGEEMSRRDKGPLWIVYPYDSDLKYQTEIIYSRSIWQLDRISVE